jgi:Xaa-Pro aminopeptidase
MNVGKPYNSTLKPEKEKINISYVNLINGLYIPFIAQGQSYPLEEGMTFAVEPKIVFPGEGSVGLENTVVVTEKGYEILTPVSQKIFQV